MTSGPERSLVEQPFIDHLVRMGWSYTTGNVDHPSATGRDTFRDVLLKADLRESLRRINLDPSGKPWLDESRISQAISSLERLSAPNLIEANKEATHLLLRGTEVDGVEGWDQGRARLVRFVDWDNPEANTFRVVDQFRVDEPGGQTLRYILPDLVLFVNGIPVGVVECKSPHQENPLEAAVDQLQRYSNRRRAMGLTDLDEGNEELFHYNQLLVATSFEEARLGTITARAVHFLEWKDTTPVPEAEVAAALGIESLSSQQRLVAGVLRPRNLLDILRHFTLFKTERGQTLKLVARYQQFRAVKNAIDRLLSGKTRKEDGEHDRRGGIIWHTQGSGKSLTMVFLVRAMRAHPQLRTFKVVVVTDRQDLEKQLSDTADLTGEPLRIARRSSELQALLEEKGPGLVFGLIQKYQGDEAEGTEEPESLPTLNRDESILVLVDEAHRSHTSSLHANLMNALPNCAKIGFTGTPILMGAKKRTHEIFGDFIDRYTIQQSEADGATVPILYEGRTQSAAVSGGGELDDLFEDFFRDRSPEEMEQIKEKYATRGNVLEARRLIEAKARDMLRHYVENILPNGFKAQVVAVSRRAAARYDEAFRLAKKELLEELDGADPSLAEIDEEELATLPRRTQFHARALRVRELLEQLEFAPVFSSSHNDPPHWAKWTDRSAIDSRIERFKSPFPNQDAEGGDPLGILIVKSMLLTGFDAPVEQALYLDRHMKQAELLQAIARVNRTYPHKAAGLVIDYYGVAHHLQEALAVYSEEDVEGALRSLQEELPNLALRHRAVIALFTERGVDTLEDEESCVELLEDEKLRAEFQVKLKRFLSTLDLILPRPEALPYLPDSKRLSAIQARARNRYRDDVRLIGKDVGKKVGKLIDQHLVSLGIDTSIAPIALLDKSFDRELGEQRSPKAKASEMEHAIRHHIRKHRDEDPELFEKLSERLERIVKDLKGQWDDLLREFQAIKRDIEEGREDDPFGLDDVSARFLGVLAQEMKKEGVGSPAELEQVAEHVPQLVELVRKDIGHVGFWKNPIAQHELKGKLVLFMDDLGILPMDRQERTADRLVELAKANRHRMTPS